MFEFSFILPPASADYVKEWLAREVGGYTVHEVTGGWINAEGKLVEEPMLRYIVAADATMEDRLLSGAYHSAKLERQEALYFHGVEGVSIIDIEYSA